MKALVILYHPDHHHHQQPSARPPAGRRAKATALSSRCRGDIWVVTCRMYRLKKIQRARGVRAGVEVVKESVLIILANTFAAIWRV